MFVHLSAHSYYSFLEGIPSPAELVHAAAQAGMPALALTDINGLTGVVEFQDRCDFEGIQSLLGMELYVLPPEEGSFSNSISFSRNQSGGNLRPPYERLTLLVEDQQGWANLCWLSSKVHSDPSGSISPVSFDDLASHNQGLVCLAGGARTLIYDFSRQEDEITLRLLLSTLADIYPRSLYANLQIHQPKDTRPVTHLASLARRLNLPLVASHSNYYLDPKEADLQHLVASIRLNCELRNLPDHEKAPPHAHFHTPEEMNRRFQGYPQSIQNTIQISERCRYRLPLGQTHFPIPHLPPGESADHVLRMKAQSGARERYHQISAHIQKRLDHELEVIEKCGYAPLFLIVEEIIRFTREQNIPFSSRGSAASSLVAYCLGITTPDPLKLNLYFERFLNPARATPPDIDTDLCSKRRSEVLTFVIHEFGMDRVAMVGTINHFRERSALRETAKAHGLSAAKINEMVERLPSYWFGSRSEGEKTPFENLSQAFPQFENQLVINQASQVLRMPRHLSIHPGGVVIAPNIMTDLVPTQLASKGLPITQFDHFHIERLGLVKIDLLGIRGLSVLGDVETSLMQGVEKFKNAMETTQDHKKITNMIPWPTFDQDQEIDPGVSRMLQDGQTIGCFQIESPGMRATLREINANCLEDIMVALALYRPGPLTGGLKRTFVERYRAHQNGNLDDVEHLHPSLAPLLNETYGVILYQEQVLRIAHELAGFTLAEADLLRRAMSHYDPGKQMQTLKEKFLAGTYEKEKVPSSIAEHIWELMAAFAGYGFPKAHAASYAQIAWRAAWSKVHYPAIFMAAVLANWGGYYSQRVYLNEARRMKLQIHAPHINYAQREFSVSYNKGNPALYMGLDQVRDLTRRTQKMILTYRPFLSLTDFLVKVDPRPQEVENLIRVGGFDGLGSIPDLLRQVQRKDWKSGQFPLFAEVRETIEENWSVEQIMIDQETILGTAVIAHPLDLAAEQIKASGAISTVEAIQCSGENVRVAGVRQTWRRGKTTHGEVYYFMSLEDLEGMLDVFISDDIYRRYRYALSRPGPWIVEGVMEPNRLSGECTLRASRVELA